MPIPSFPTIVTRSGKGSPLLDSELDGNFTNLQSYCLALANLLSTSINPDGTLTIGSVGSSALQAAAVGLLNLNPSLLYSIVPVDNDSGTVDAYAITARGGLGGSNLVPNSSTYDANGNYVLTGLTLNYGYYWTMGTHDTSAIVNSQQTLTASGAFTAIQSSVQLTGSPGATITATVVQAAPISAYKNGQMFFVYTLNGNIGAATLNVNGIGSIPITLGGAPLKGGEILANSVFAVCYQNGSFILISGAGSGSGSQSSSGVSYSINGTNQFSSGNLSIPGNNASITLAHGLGSVPSSVQVLLYKKATDSTSAGVGDYVSAGQFKQASTLSTDAFFIAFDSTNIYVTQANDTPALEGTAITAASWNLIINATHQDTLSNIVFPALSYQFTQPEGAFSYGNNLVVFNMGKAQSHVVGTAVNLTNNEASFVQSNNTQGAYNFAPWTRADGTLIAVYTAVNGVYTIPLANPLADLIPAGAMYDSSGAYNATITASTAYTLTKGANDLQYSLDGSTYLNLTSTPVNIPSTNTSTTLYLKGVAGGNVTATLTTIASTWQATSIFTNTSLDRKPVYVTETGGSITNVYVCPSGYNAKNYISAVQMFQINNSGVTSVGTNLDMTNSGIGNISAFLNWVKSGSAAYVLFFQYNQISRRIYVMTNECGLLHIFQITANYGSGGVTNDITAFWQDSGRYGNLAYVKTIAVSGAGDTWGNSDRENYYIEVDQSTGKEKAIVFVRDGNTFTVGSVTRVPWVE